MIHSKGGEDCNSSTKNPRKKSKDKVHPTLSPELSPEQLGLHIQDTGGTPAKDGIPPIAPLSINKKKKKENLYEAAKRARQNAQEAGCLPAQDRAEYRDLSMANILACHRAKKHNFGVREFWSELTQDCIDEWNHEAWSPADPRARHSFMSMNIGAVTRMKARASRARRNLSKKTPKIKRTVNPKNRWKKAWDIYIGLIIFYSAIYIPISISFLTGQSSSTWLYSLQLFFDICFWVDICICFVTAYYEEERLVHSHKKIAMNYLKGWFFVDFLAAFPFEEVFASMGGGGQNWEAGKLFKILRIFRLAKALKLSHLLKEVDPVLLSIFKTLGKVVIAAHFMCCIWFWVACNQVTSNIDSYDAQDDLNDDTKVWDKCGDPDSFWSRYLAGFYFIIYTIMAVGYGEIHADTNSERIMAMFLQISGAALFGLIIATTKKIIHILDPIQEAKGEHMREFSEYITDRNLTDNLQNKLKSHYAYYLFKKSTFDENVLYKQLPVVLRFSLSEEVNRIILHSLILLENDQICHRARLQLAQCLKPMQLELKEYIIDENSILTEMYFIIKGKVTGVQNDFLKGFIFIGTWGAGSDFGLDNLLLQNPAPANYIAASTVDLLWLSEMDLRVAMETYDGLKFAFQYTAKQYNQNMKAVLMSEEIVQDEQYFKTRIIIDHKIIQTKQHLKHGDTAMLSLFKDGPAETSTPTRGGFHNHRMLRTWSSGMGMIAKDKEGNILPGICELEETVYDLNSRLIFLSDQTRMVDWDVVVMALLIFSSIIIPVRVAFDLESNGMLAMDIILDSIFMLDIIIKFRLAYAEIGDNNIKVHVTVPRMIAVRYIKSWFIVDFLSAVPFNLLLDNEEFLALKLLRLLRLQTISSVLRAVQSLKAADSSTRKHHYEIPRWIKEVLRVFIAIYFSAHLFACFFFAVSKHNTEDSWWVYDNVDPKDIGKAYLASIYWALTTMATVGYGDIYPQNDLERLFASIIMLLGSTMFGYVVGSVSSLARDPHGGSVRQNNRMQEITDYLENKGVSLQLRDSIKLHAKHFMNVRSPFDTEKFLSRLPARLKQEVLLQIHEDHIPKIVIFHEKEASFVAKILQYMIPVKFSEGDEVYSCEEKSQGIYFVVRGVAEIYIEEEAANGTVEQKLLSIIQEGKLFGYVRFLIAAEGEIPEEAINIGARAFTLLQCFLLRTADISLLLKYFPGIAEELRKEVEQSIWFQAKSEMRSRQTKSAVEHRENKRIGNRIKRASTGNRRRSSQVRFVSRTISRGSQGGYRNSTSSEHTLPRGSRGSPTRASVQGSSNFSERLGSADGGDRVVKLSKWVTEKIDKDSESKTSVSTTILGASRRRGSLGLTGRRASVGSQGSLRDLRTARRLSSGLIQPKLTKNGSESMNAFLMKVLSNQVDSHCTAPERPLSSARGGVVKQIIEEVEDSEFKQAPKLFTMMSGLDERINDSVHTEEKKSENNESALDLPKFKDGFSPQNSGYNRIARYTDDFDSTGSNTSVISLDQHPKEN